MEFDASKDISACINKDAQKKRSLGAKSPQLLKARVDKQRAKASPKARAQRRAKAKAKARLQLQEMAKVHTVAVQTKRSQKEMARQKARARTRRARENQVSDGKEFGYTPAGKGSYKVQSHHAGCQSQ